jgi:hypothetical protein
MEKLAQAYFYKGRFILVPMVKTDRGMYLAVGKCLEIGLSGSENDSGNGMMSILNEFRDDFPHPDLRNLIESEAPILKFLGIKKYSVLMKSAKLVILRLVDGNLRFIPNKNEGGNGGYVDILDLEFKVEASSVERLFASLKDAFELCQ